MLRLDIVVDTRRGLLECYPRILYHFIEHRDFNGNQELC